MATSFRGLVELRPDFQPRPKASHVLFDFDGTLSLIRQGWPEIMLPLFCEFLPRVHGDTEESIRQLLYDDMMRLNGKQTIYQMIQFADRVRQRGGIPKEPVWYKEEYLRRLELHIASRISGLQTGSIRPDELLVHNARVLLTHLRQLGFSLYLASGTDEPSVKREADLLQVSHFFEGRIYGAQPDYQSFSKRKVIERILLENNIPGAQLLAFGDGYVEIENTKQVGGFAIAVASDEANNGSGQYDPWKRQRLLAVGADAVIPDYRDGVLLVDLVRGTAPMPSPASIVSA